MSAKENLGGKTEEFKEGRIASTAKESHPTPSNASEKSSLAAKKIPRHGSKMRVLLDTLRDNAGEWVALLDLSRATELAAVHSGVATLRAGGWTIKNRMEHHPFRGGTSKHSFYKLEENPK